MIKIFLFLVTIMITAVTIAGQPLSQSLLLMPLNDTAKLQLPKIDKASLLKNSVELILNHPKGPIVRPLKISETSPINKPMSQLGQWQTINGQSIWRLKITAEEALHLNLGFKKLYLPGSAKLFISNAKTGEVLQHYSFTDNKFHGELWTPLLNTNEILLELNIDEAEKGQVSFNLIQAGQGFKVIDPADENYKSGSCNIDVKCPEGDAWSNEIRSVARYTISDSQGTFVCTGTLVNNTRADLAPLFLTAAHCLVSDTTAASMIFYWNYETSVCDGTPDGSLDQTQSGATFVSRWEGLSNTSDFALVRLDSIPALSSNIYYAGWDNRDQTTTGSRTIHHPNGDEKRISGDSELLSITDFSEDTSISTSGYLKVAMWDFGTTESGSSGAGLWSLDHHIIGTLTGGEASCTALTGADWYGRFSKHWAGNNFESNQLVSYLDPADTAAATLDGNNSCDAPLVSITVSSNNPAVSEQISFMSTVTAGAGSYTYEWDFENDGVVDSIDANPIHTYTSATNNHARLVVRDSSLCPAIASTWVLAADTSEAFLGDGNLPDGFTKTSAAVGSWIVDDSRASEGIFSLKSQIVNGDNNSSIELTGNYQKGTISFDRRVSSEATFDFFKFYIDGIEQMSVSGELDWSNVSFPINAGSHTFRWSFEKDAAVSGGQDSAWMDKLVFAESPPPPPPAKKNSGGGAIDLLFLVLLLISFNFKKNSAPTTRTHHL